MSYADFRALGRWHETWHETARRQEWGRMDTREGAELLRQ
jgi:hypothetical protein